MRTDLPLKTVIESEDLINSDRRAEMANNLERESDICRNEDGSPIENSTPEDLVRELGVTMKEANKMLGLTDDRH